MWPIAMIGSAESWSGRSATAGRRSSRSVTIWSEVKIVIGIMEHMATPGDAEKPARKTIHLHRLFDRKQPEPRRPERPEDTVSDRAAPPAGSGSAGR
jgi:hypothetical protein